MEVEAKFAITGELDTKALDSLDIRPYSLRSKGIEEHIDTLLDTPSRRITTQLHALRIRASGSTLILTLKGPNAGEGEVHIRREWEALLTPPLQLDSESWPEPIASRVAELAQGEPLAPLLYLTVERRLWDVKRASHVIGELALDTGVILAGGRREPVRELELELKGSGARADLDVLRERLTSQLPLAPESRSKLQRGLALLRHARWTLDGYTSLEAVARHYVRQQMRSMSHAAREVVEKGDPDSIHDMRVAIRRIRTVLFEMEAMDPFRPRALRALRSGLRGAARSLGAVRDLDIILEQIAAHTTSDASKADTPHHEALAHVVEALRSRRQEAYHNALRAIQRHRFERLIEKLRRFDVARDTPGPLGQCALVREYAGGALWARYETLIRRQPSIDLGDTPGMHQARIAAKRLRYTLELFAPTLGKRIEPMRRALVTFQASFGSLQDITVTMRTLADLASDDERSPALTLLMTRLESEHARLQGEARSTWRPLVSKDTRQALARTLAAL